MWLRILPVSACTSSFVVACSNRHIRTSCYHNSPMQTFEPLTINLAVTMSAGIRIFHKFGTATCT